MQRLERMKESWQEAFAEVWDATKTSLADAWRNNRRLPLQLFAASALIAVVPYVANGVNALFINHLVIAFGSGVFDALLWILVLLGAGVMLLRTSSFDLYRYFEKLHWFSLNEHYSIRLSERLSQLDVATHENPKFRDRVQLVQEHGSAAMVANYIESLIMNSQNVIGVIIASSIVLLVDPWLFLIILVASIPHFYVELRYGRGVWSIFQAHSEARRHYFEARRHSESAEGVRDLKVFQAGPFFLSRQRTLLREFYEAQQGEEQKKLLLQVGAQVLVVGAILYATFVLVSGVVAGSMQIGTFIFVLTAITGLQDAISGFFLSLASQRKEARAVKAFFDILRQEPIIVSPEGGKRLAGEGAPTIEFRNVSFAYPTSPGHLVLSDFSLTIHSGERIAFVGVNGAGKSTLIKLLCRFYDPTEGAIYIDGVDLREIVLETWYTRLALLAQDYATYRVKAWEAINLGRLNGARHQESITDAAQRSDAEQFIEKWAGKYEQQIGVEFEGGVDPSGGQQQKLALARTLYRNALVTILDEPTAHVDAGAEREIFNNLENNLGRHQTLILISHRFSTVRNADRICIVEDGGVRELGSHDELVALGGTYARLFEQQAERYR